MSPKVIFFLLLFIPISIYSQITVTNSGYTATQLVEDILLGGGVTVSNVAFTGSGKAIGVFNDGNNSNLGLGSGILLTSGDINNAPGPNNSSSSSLGNNLSGDNDLTTIAGYTTFDATILEFDFVVSSDEVSFEYVFGSEEYPEFVNSGVNDAFGFFISGPGINGSYQNSAENIALIPGTNTAVSINTVNEGNYNCFSTPTGCNNCTYYVDNCSGTTIQYDGFTTVLEAKISGLQLCETYHIKIAIADAGDHVYDSGVFLKANSFSSPVSFSYFLPTFLFNESDSLFYEGCGEATLQFIKSSNANDTILLEVSGTATNGIDYTYIPDTLYFTNSDTMEYYLSAFSDSILEPGETLDIKILSSACGDSSSTSYSITLSDVEDIMVIIPEDTILTCPENFYIESVTSGGLGYYSYTWSTGSDSSSTYLYADSTQEVIVLVENALDSLCVLPPANDTINVKLDYVAVSISSSPDYSLFCPENTYVYAIVSDSLLNDSIKWFENGILIETGSDTYLNPAQTTSYIIEVNDLCGVTYFDTITVSLPNTDSLKLHISNDTSLFCPNAIDISGFATGGFGYYNYNWSTGNSDTILNIFPDSTTTYYLTVSDSCKLYEVIDSVVVNMPDIAPLKVNLPNDSNLCPGSEIMVNPVIWGGQGGYTVLWNGINVASDTILELTVDSIHNYVISITDSCGNTVTDTLQYTALEVISGLAVTNESANSASFNATIVNGNVVEWDFGDGTTSVSENPLHEYNEPGVYEVMLVVKNQLGCLDTLYTTVEINDEFTVVSNTFTPNGDGVNDYFEIPNEGLDEFYIQIYNRWGKLIYETNDSHQYWDGKTKGGRNVPSGTYFYMVSASSPFNDFSEHGTITLINE